MMHDDEPEIELEPEQDDATIEWEEDPEVEIEPERDVEIEPEPAPAALAPVTGDVRMPLAELMPADFRLPLLTKFIPNPALKAAVDDWATKALAIEVADGGEAKVREADEALTNLRGALDAVTAEFEEPTEVANDLHKRLTGLRSEWRKPGAEALQLVNARVFAEVARLKRIADEQRRKEQEAADAREKESRRREAEEAALAGAPADIVADMAKQAETATAAPVQPYKAATSRSFGLSGSTPTKTWKARLGGTKGDEDPNPEDLASLSVEQKASLHELLRSVIVGQNLNAIAVNWSYLNGRAKSDKSTFQMPGLEAFEEGGMRKKPAARVK